VIAALLLGAAIREPLAAQTAAEYGAQALDAAKAKKWADAIVLYRQALEIDPKDASTHYNLGAILLAQTDIKGALAEFRTADQLRPHDAAIECSLGRAYLQNAQPADAIARFRKCVPLRAKDAESRY
jgi:Flp pilus assembly protein TadD